MFVGVTGANRAPVDGLAPADFVVREDGIAREVIAVAPAPPPSHLALLVDDSDAARTIVSDLRSGLNGFLARLATLGSPPAVSVMTFGERPTKVSDFSTSIPIAARAIQRITPRPDSGAYFLDAIIEASRDLQKQKAERPVIVAFVIDDSPEFSERTHQSIEKALMEAHTSLSVVVLQSGRPSDSPLVRERNVVIGDTTSATGGVQQLILSKEGIAHGLDAVASALLSRYDVTYGRPDSMIPPSKLSVEVRDRSLRVTAPHAP
ncbi:MAG: hypothetical protein ABI652_03735 [Acidobacteriota bacterium]